MADPKHLKRRRWKPQLEFEEVQPVRRSGGFVRLLEALDSLGLEVTNANVTNSKSLVSNVFWPASGGGGGKDDDKDDDEYSRKALEGIYGFCIVLAAKTDYK
ncbi:hypothetical protein LINPERPRIM_LOCUS31240, partial [Linum perenne]